MKLLNEYETEDEIVAIVRSKNDLTIQAIMDEFDCTPEGWEQIDKLGDWKFYMITFSN